MPQPMPALNTMPDIIIKHMSRHVWMESGLLYDLLWQIGEMPTKDNFKVVFSNLLHNKFIEARYNHSGWIGDQYRLTEETANRLPKVKRGRVMGRKPLVEFVWFKSPLSRLRSVV